MREALCLQGRRLDPSDVQALCQWLEEHPDWSRWRLSRELAERWCWRNGAGELKDMAARSLLVKLEQHGLIRLPARRQVPTNRMRCLASPVRLAEQDSTPIEGNLRELGALTMNEVSGQTAERAWVKAALGQFHYLGFGGAVGENLQYVISDGAERPLACLVFGAAAWKCQGRDQFIGWSAEQRQSQLELIANNSRFLILPWVKVPHLGSWILGQVSRRIGRDWQTKYGHGVELLETFVERDRFRGTVYQAANWLKVGQTAGRTRQDRHNRIQAPVKDIYVYPLRRHFREMLCL